MITIIIPAIVYVFLNILHCSFIEILTISKINVYMYPDEARNDDGHF